MFLKKKIQKNVFSKNIKNVQNVGVLLASPSKTWIAPHAIVLELKKVPKIFKKNGPLWGGPHESSKMIIFTHGLTFKMATFWAPPILDFGEPKTQNRKIFGTFEKKVKMYPRIFQKWVLNLVK